MQEFIEKTIKEAGKAIMTFFGHAEVAYTKADIHDVVTQADLASNKIITEAIRKQYPDHAIISEEDTDTSKQEPYKWYIDPLDGTKNFSTHVPLFGINIALTKDGILTHGAIYLPVFDELVYAEKGKGAWFNGKKLEHVLEKDLVATYGLMSAQHKERPMKVCLELLQLAGGKLWINNLGSKAVSGMYMATGRRDWQISFTGGSWDYAAPVVILQEVGYQVTDLDGNEWRLENPGFVVAHPGLHPRLVEILKRNK